MRSQLTHSLEKGIYRHYKGNFYEVLCVGKLEETLEDVVIYRSCKDEKEIWVRPLTQFMEEVEVNHQRMPRFQKQK